MDKPSDLQLPTLSEITCSVCHREIPLSTAMWRETSDYVAYFCGLECYDQWRRQ